jgi:hypothetical protein
MTTTQTMPGAGESRRLKIRALLALRSHSRTLNGHTIGKPARLSFSPPISWSPNNSLDHDTHEVVDELEAAQANTTKLVSMLVKC